MFEEMLLKLKILGKFLGYLVFFPYQYPVASYCIKDLSSIRNNVILKNLNIGKKINFFLIAIDAN